MEIPLLRESQTFADRVCVAAQAFGESRYHLDRRINWSYRYCREYYTREAAHFCKNPDIYIAGNVPDPPIISDVFASRVYTKQLVAIFIKVIVHWVFAAVGKLMYLNRSHHLSAYRKCYVDDIELAYDPAANGVLRAIFPFPLSPKRQWLYCRHLRRSGLPFVLDGNRYSLGDILHLIKHRNFRALMRLESRAEIRLATKVKLGKYDRIELSDEFNIGSLDFARTLRRAKMITVNSAHGIGKYFPVHAYDCFRVLNSKQKSYYRSFRPCQYENFQLFSTFGVNKALTNASVPNVSGKINFVFLSQKIDNGNSIIEREENTVIEIISNIAINKKLLSLYYKPHPNNTNFGSLKSWIIVSSIDEINSIEAPILVSFFSTCHIDERFKGQKYLIRSGLLRPEIAYDDNGDIIDCRELSKLLGSG